MTNMTILKSLEYSCLQICNVDDAKVIDIDRICTCSKLIFQPESNKHRTKTENKKTHRAKMGNQKHTTQRREIKTNRVVRDDEITKTNE
ncbi:cysteine protease, putative [Medicago truncatula]|uniref:Cysteine protease, putative n=1 Tax=Medicago truncatula TaxID=3880 RepID=G7IH53_MEDTR|nr:cysteine protease, putative [Medicago truncatula]